MKSQISRIQNDVSDIGEQNYKIQSDVAETNMVSRCFLGCWFRMKKHVSKLANEGSNVVD